MRLVSLQELCRIFQVDPATLRNWIRRANIKVEIDPVDNRKKSIAQSDAVRLARLHGHMLPSSHVAYLAQSSQDYREDVEMESEVYRDISDKIEAVAMKLNELEKKHAALQTHLDTITTKLDTLAASLPMPKRDTLSQVAPTRAPETPAHVPPRSITMRDFAKAHGLTRDWLEPRIERGELSALIVPFRNGKQYWFSPEHKQEVIAYLRQHGVKYGECDEQGCACHVS